MVDGTDEIQLAERLVRIEAAIEALRADLARYFAEHADHEKRLRALEKEQSTHSERLKGHENRLDSLSARVNAWGSTNTIGAIVAGIIGWFK